MVNYLQLGQGLMKHLPQGDGCTSTIKLGKRGLEQLSKKNPELGKTIAEFTEGASNPTMEIVQKAQGNYAIAGFKIRNGETVLSKGAYSTSNGANGVVEKMHLEQDGIITTISKENGKTKMNVVDGKNNTKIIEPPKEKVPEVVQPQAQEIKTKDKIIKINPDGTQEEIISRKHNLGGRHYVEKNLYDKNGNCTATILESEHGTLTSTVIEQDRWGNGVYKIEGHLKINPNNTKKTFIYRQNRNDKELVEASVKALDGSSYTLALEKDQYGFETGYYTLTKISRTGKKQTSRVYPAQININKQHNRILDSFKIGDCEFLTDMGIKSLVL